jgi:flagellar basal body-associated protein FliL
MMEKLFRGAKAPLLVIILCVLVLIAAVVGGLVVIFGSSLSFQDYLNALWKFALSVAVLGFGTSVADAYSSKVINGNKTNETPSAIEEPAPSTEAEPPPKPAPTHHRRSTK